MAADDTHGSLDNSFVPMMITRIILSLKKAASTPPKFEMVQVPTGFPAGAFQDLEELPYNKENGMFPHPAERIRPPPGLSPV